MMDFSKNDFSKAKIGDEVWSIHQGWGVVKEINLHEQYPIGVSFRGETCQTFTFDGRCWIGHKYPTLFWNEIQFEIPERPKRKVKKEITVWACIRGGLILETTYHPLTADRWLNNGYQVEEFTKEIELEEGE
jgi:hypothetical protein